MSKETQTYILLVGLALTALALAAKTGSIHLPGNHQDYEPTQPIAFSHRLHSGELGMDCLYCHYGAEQSRHAGVPAASVCMNCHKFVTSTLGAIQAEDKLAEEEERKPQPVMSPELEKLYAALGLGNREEIAAWTPLAGKPPPAAKSIDWIKIHNLPDFAYFDHRAHVSAGLECQKCHGNVETMERVRQVETLAMGWCVNCHRLANKIGVNAQPVHASTDCSTCHY